MKIEFKICPKCGQKNILEANYCTHSGCGYLFKKEDSKNELASTPSVTEPEASTSVNISDGDAPILDFESFSDDTVIQIRNEINSCKQHLKTINLLNNNDDEAINKTYKKYVANFKNMDEAMRKIELLAKKIDDYYKKANEKLKNGLPARQKSLKRAYEEKKEIVLSLVTRNVEEFIKIKPFDQCKSFQISPIKEWGSFSVSSQFPQHFLYLGKVHRKYTIFNKDFSISRREYLELLNRQNLIIHHDNLSEDMCVSLATTLLCRMMKETKGQNLHVHVIDPKLGLGLNADFYKGLPQKLYSVVKEIDLTDIWTQECRILQMTGGDSVENYNRCRNVGQSILGYNIVIFKDWYATLEGRIDEDLILKMVNNSVNAGFCFIFMINDDNKPKETSYRHDDESIMSQLPNCALIDLKQRKADYGQKLELMSDEQIFEVIKEMRNVVRPQSKDIDVGTLLEEKKRWGKSDCKDGFSLYIGKDGSLQDIQLDFIDDFSHQSLLVNYRGAKSKVFPWMNAMIAQVFTLYNPEELNVMIADFTGNKEIAALTSYFNLTIAPLYFLDLKISSQANTGEFLGKFNKFAGNVDKWLNDSKNNDKRILIFIVGQYETVVKRLTQKGYLVRDRLNIVLLTTDFVVDEMKKQQGIERAPISFGPMYLESKSSLYREEGAQRFVSGDEFKYMGTVGLAYTYSVDDTKKILQKYVKEVEVAQSSSGESTLPTYEIDDSGKGLEVKEEKTEKKQQASEDPSHPATTVDAEKTDISGNSEKEEKYGYEKLFGFNNLPEKDWWKQSCKEAIEVPVCIHINEKTGEEEEWSFKFIDGKPEANAGFVLGKPGSGKSGFLNTFIIGAAQRYSPKELEFYLIDFKTVGFFPYELFNLPHARVVASGDDPDFTFSILQQLRAELERRKNLQIKSDSDTSYPRTILIIDECHHFFRTGDAMSKNAVKLLETLVKEGRSFRMNVIFATQMLSSDSDSTYIPGSIYDLVAARVVGQVFSGDYPKLYRDREISDVTTLNSYGVGEMMFTQKGMPLNLDLEDYHTKSYYIQYDSNDARADSELKTAIERLALFAETHRDECPNGIIPFKFHNDDELVEFNANRRMRKEHLTPVDSLPHEIPVYLGQAIGMAPDVYMTLEKKSEQNVLIMGLSNANLGQSILHKALLSSLLAYPCDKNGRATNRIDYVFDFTITEDPLYGQLAKIIETPPFNAKSEVIPNNKKQVEAKLSEIKAMLEARMEQVQDEVDSHVFVSIFGLERGNMFGEINGYTNKEATDLLSYILTNGPNCGIFTMIQYSGRWDGLQTKINSPATIFNHIVALQTDEKIIPDDIVNLKTLYPQSEAKEKDKNGLYRAVYYDRRDPQIYHKFKPYKI